jgi:hypothetical protein
MPFKQPDEQRLTRVIEISKSDFTNCLGHGIKISAFKEDKCILGVNLKIDLQSVAVTKNQGKGILINNLALLHVRITGCDISRNDQHNLSLKQVH